MAKLSEPRQRSNTLTAGNLRKKRRAMISDMRRKHPADFCRRFFRSKLTPSQVELINKACTPGVRKIAWKSGHGIGKSFAAGNLMAAFALMNFDPKVPTLVVMTAPTGRQAKGAPWEEMKRCVERMNGYVHRNKTTGAQLRFSLAGDDCPGDQAWKIKGQTVATHFTADPNRPEAFQGFHAAKILVIIDEASGVDDRIVKAAETLVTGEDATVVLLGNPTVAGNAFERAFSATSDWVQITSSCFDHPNVLQDREVIPGAVTRQWILDQWNDPVIGDGTPLRFPAGPQPSWEKWADWPRALAHANAWWRGHVLGEFPTDSTNKLIALSWVEAAFQREVRPPSEGARFMGMDVARFGSDNTAIAITTPTDALHIELHPITSGPKAVKLARGAARDWNVDPRNVRVDATGMGGMGVVDWLREFAEVKFSTREEGFWKYCVGVEFAAKAHQHQIFVNRKAEILWNLAKRLEHGNLGLKNLSPKMKEVLRNQLPKLMYEIRGGRFAIESKDQYKKRAGSSPDAAEALALAVWPWGEPERADEDKTPAQIAADMGLHMTGMPITDNAGHLPDPKDGRRVSENPLYATKTEAEEDDERELAELLASVEADVGFTLGEDDEDTAGGL